MFLTHFTLHALNLATFGSSVVVGCTVWSRKGSVGKIHVDLHLHRPEVSAVVKPHLSGVVGSRIVGIDGESVSGSHELKPKQASMANMNIEINFI